MLNLTYVNTFVSVIETGSFRAAARRLACAQPTVTQHIKKLEAALQAPLVARSHAACMPTAHGERFLPFARSLLQVADRARAAVAGRRLTVGASTNIGTYLLPQRLKAFAGRNGVDVTVEPRIAGNPAVAEMLAAGEIDMALMEWPPTLAGFNAVVWRHEPMVVIVPPDHPWAGRRSVSRAKLLAMPLLGGEAGTGTATLLARIFGDDARDLKIEMTLGSTEAVKQAVIAGLGISLTLACAVRDDVDSGRLAALPIAGARLTKALYLVTPTDIPPTSPIAAFADFLRAEG